MPNIEHLSASLGGREGLCVDFHAVLKCRVEQLPLRVERRRSFGEDRGDFDAQLVRPRCGTVGLVASLSFAASSLVCRLKAATLLRQRVNIAPPNNSSGLMNVSTGASHTQMDCCAPPTTMLTTVTSSGAGASSSASAAVAGRGARFGCLQSMHTVDSTKVGRRQSSQHTTRVNARYHAWVGRVVRVSGATFATEAPSFR